MKITAEIASQVAENFQLSIAKSRAELKETMWAALSHLEAVIVQNIRSRSGLKVRTGALLNSIGRSKKVVESGNTVTGSIGPEGVPYAAMHEFGGTIVPKNAQNLTIPIGTNRRRDGTAISSPAEVMRDGGFIRNGVMFSKNGQSVQPMFLLRKSVTIPARPFLAPAISASSDKILQNFGLFLATTFKSTKE